MAVGDRSGHGYASYLVFGPRFRLPGAARTIFVTVRKYCEHSFPGQPGREVPTSSGLSDLKSGRAGFQIRPLDELHRATRRVGDGAEGSR